MQELTLNVTHNSQPRPYSQHVQHVQTSTNKEKPYSFALFNLRLYKAKIVVLSYGGSLHMLLMFKMRPCSQHIEFKILVSSLSLICLIMCDSFSATTAKSTEFANLDFFLVHFN